MTAVRSGGSRGWSDGTLVITDPDGDYLTVDRLVRNSREDVALVATGGAGAGAVRLGLDDVLALLSFLADAAGVERFVPGGAL